MRYFSRQVIAAVALAAGCQTSAEPLPPGDRLMALAERPGFEVREQGGALWVRRTDEEAVAKPTTLIGAGPGGCAIKAQDRQTALEFLATKPGFRVEVEDADIWVMRGEQERVEDPVTLTGAGPRGMTVKAVDRDTALTYVATTPGFEIELDGDELWVFRAGRRHDRSGMPVMRTGAGPRRLTLRAPDNGTVDAYLAVRAEMARGDGSGPALHP